jgi:hypothetical protein
MANFEYKIDGEKNVVNVKIIGRLTLQEMIAFTNVIIYDPYHRPGMNFITDLTEAEIDSSFELLSRFLHHLRAHELSLGKFRWALIVNEPANRMAGELLRGLSTLSDAYVLELFEGYQAAENWCQHDLTIS